MTKLSWALATSPWGTLGPTGALGVNGLLVLTDETVTAGDSALLLPAASMARTWYLNVLALERWSVKLVAVCFVPMATPSRKTR